MGRTLHPRALHKTRTRRLPGSRRVGSEGRAGDATPAVRPGAIQSTVERMRLVATGVAFEKAGRWPAAIPATGRMIRVLRGPSLTGLLRAILRHPRPAPAAAPAVANPFGGISSPRAPGPARSPLASGGRSRSIERDEARSPGADDLRSRSTTKNARLA